MTTNQLLSTAWSWNPWTLLVGIVAIGLYLSIFGLHRRLIWLMGALVVFLLTLDSPLDALANGYLFSAHMMQHILLLLIIPALILLSLPSDVSLAVRPTILQKPAMGWFAGVSAMWVWHLPALCNAAVADPFVRLLQTASLIVMGSLFWRAILAPREAERLQPPNAIGYLFSACITCSILGIMITFSPVEVCSIYTMPSMDRLGLMPLLRNQWGMSPQRDQQLGGLLMWVPMCLIYLVAILAQIGRWFAGTKTIRMDI